MAKSQPSSKTSQTSPWMCWPGVSLGRRSQDHASCPKDAKESRTIPLNSHPIKTRILMPSTMPKLKPTGDEPEHLPAPLALTEPAPVRAFAIHRAGFDMHGIAPWIVLKQLP